MSRSFAFVSAISTAQTPAEIGGQLVRLAKTFGFSSVYGGLVPRCRKSQSEVAPLTLVQHVPVEWAARYNARNYLFRDPVFRRLQSDAQPFTWADSYASCSSIVDRTLISGEAATFGLTGGFVVPVITLEERIAAVSFGGNRPALGPDEAHRLAFAANCAIGRFVQLHAAPRHLPAHLTPREYECLQWTVEGKSESDISEILHVSTSTISKHIAAVRGKLSAINKAHAVAIAIRMKIV